MIAFPNCKINLGLHITAKRQDGYHDIETVFYPITWKDVIEVISDDGNREMSIVNDKTSNFEFQTSGLKIKGDAKGNLCVKAYNLLKKDFPSLPPVKMHLHKVIPMGAGLGGGSADGAFMLKLLNDKFQLGLSKDQLIHYALQLGSDCPFFIINEACFAKGRGEILEPVALDLSVYSFVIINPGVHINTGWAFQQLSPRQPAKSIKEIISQPILVWKDELKNDFEDAVFKTHPLIAEIKQQLYDAGALYSSMTGSGSTVFGIFKKSKTPGLSFSEGYTVKKI
ncbi:MAG: 4-diphosphocytidyl-2C-methyl-D-erythritol kinase [Chitinophagaceae bacterium]|nr:4-diphosphocytidyl-2C-methyl-D-erythritol kinase [Chitinophagaceae bacterium]